MDLSAIGAVIYAIGWGPVFAVALVIGAADMMRRTGSAVAKPVIVFSVFVIGTGQLGVGLGLVPSLIRQPLAHGIAGLEPAAVVLIVALLGWFASARESAERELRHRERRFSALVNNSADIVMVIGPEGELGYTSPAFERLLGHDRAQVGAFEALVHPSDVNQLREAMKAARRSSTQSVERGPTYRHREHRNSLGGSRVGERAVARRGHSSLQGKGERQEPVHDLRARDAGCGVGPALFRHGPALRSGRGPVLLDVPTGLRPRQQERLRSRGPAALAPPDPWCGCARRVRTSPRGERADRRRRKTGPQRGLPSGGTVAPIGASPRDVGERVHASARVRELHRPPDRRPVGEPARPLDPRDRGD